MTTIIKQKNYNILYRNKNNNKNKKVKKINSQKFRNKKY